MTWIEGSPQALLSDCTLCPRSCHVNRLAGESGYCGAGSMVRIGRAAPHVWEEPCLSGARGSGTVFFSYCSLGCVYCQNHALSRMHQGIEVSVPRLADIFLELAGRGVHNLNLVTPSHYVPQIVQALRISRDHGFCLPVVYNSSGYESLETLHLLEGFIDVYLPDLKYCSTRYASRYSMAPDYYDIAVKAIGEMVRQAGPPQFTEDGLLKRGVLVRHMMLPGLLFDSKKIMETIRREWGDKILYSLMNQFTPCGDLSDFPEINRPLPPMQYEAMIQHALSLGMENGFIQEGPTHSESSFPSSTGRVWPFPQSLKSLHKKSISSCNKSPALPSS